MGKVYKNKDLKERDGAFQVLRGRLISKDVKERRSRRPYEPPEYLLLRVKTGIRSGTYSVFDWKLECKRWEVGSRVEVLSIQQANTVSTFIEGRVLIPASEATSLETYEHDENMAALKSLQEAEDSYKKLKKKGRT